MNLKPVVVALFLLLFTINMQAIANSVEADNADLQVKEDTEKHQLHIDWRCPFSAEYPKRMTIRKHGHQLHVKIRLGTILFNKNPKALQPPYIVPLQPDVDTVLFGDAKKVVWERHPQQAPSPTEVK